MSSFRVRIHDGSVWPFENALIAAGLKKYGCVTETQRIFEGLIVDKLSIAGSCLSLRLVRDHDAVLMEIKDNPNDLDILIHPATRHAHQLAAPNRPAISGG